MKDNRVSKLAENLLNHSVKLQKGESILVELLGTDCVDLATEIIRKAKTIRCKNIF